MPAGVGRPERRTASATCYPPDASAVADQGGFEGLRPRSVCLDGCARGPS